MRRYVSIALIVFVSCIASSVFAQVGNVADFNGKAFIEKTETAKWLCRYDRVAWVTSDSVMAAPKEEMQKIGREWFCYQSNGVWNAIYGKYENRNYNMVFHYTMDSNHVVKRIKNPVDSAMANSFSRALINASSHIKALRDSTGVAFNQYIRRDTNGDISVWLFPAFQTNGDAVYGAEYYYKYDSEGSKLLDKYEYYQGELKGFKTDKPVEISLDYRDVDDPTLGSVFFVYYYHGYFSNIVIETRKSRSELFCQKDSGCTWIHAMVDNSKNKDASDKK